MQHFGIAKEYEKDPQTISITYYCLMYVANEALKFQKDRQFAANVLDYLEAVCVNYLRIRNIDFICFSILFRLNEIIQTMK